MNEIEASILRSDWPGTRRLVRTALRKSPDSHWLITRLALTYYEEKDYARSLDILRRAFDLAPNCPLVLWDLAGTFDMLERYGEAMAIYRRLIRRGVKSIAFGDCGEGIAWARGLQADCWYRLARCQKKQGRTARAIQNFKKHLALRGPGCRSIYPLAGVRREIALAVSPT